MNQQIECIINEISSTEQIKRLRKVYTEDYFVLDHSIQSDKIICNISGSKKSVYTITITKEDEKIWCDCPDMKSFASRHSVICKHCCFVLCKIAKCTDPKVYTNKLIPQNIQIDICSRLLSICNDNCDTDCIDESLRDKYLSIKGGINPISKFDKGSKELTEDDECPICYDTLLNSDIKSCPDCKNYVHTKCIQKWLETKNTCILCRSNTWSSFFKDTNCTKKGDYIVL